MHGEAPSTSDSAVIDAARATLARIKNGLKEIGKQGLHAYLEPDEWALRKAARVLASGASKAADLAMRTELQAANALKEVASDAWQAAAGPLVLLALAYLAWKG